MHTMLSGALPFYGAVPFILRIGDSMKIVVWKSPKYLSKLLSRLFGVDGKEKKE